jgi:hypothetical protein
MTSQKNTIVIIEDRFDHFQILRNLLKYDFEIKPAVKDEEHFKCLSSDLMRFLDKEDSDFPNELNNYEDADAFIVDYDLEDDTVKTGILFCKLTGCIANGLKPVLFLTIHPASKITNEIKKVKNEIHEIVYDFLRKSEIWDDENDPIDSRAKHQDSITLANDIKQTITNLIEESARKNKKIYKSSE